MDSNINWHNLKLKNNKIYYKSKSSKTKKAMNLKRHLKYLFFINSNFTYQKIITTSCVEKKGEKNRKPY